MGRLCRDDVIIEILINWWENNKRDFPWRNTSITPYEMLIAETMLKRTRGIKVEKVFPIFIGRYPTPEALADAEEEEITEIVYPLGLQGRAKDLKRLAEMLLNDFDGDVPAERDELLSLPGVGDYTASAVRNFSMGKIDPILETNTVRISKRLWGIDEKDVHERLNAFIKRDGMSGYLMLFDFGALVCKAPKPDCENCPITRCCEFFHKRC